MIPQRCTSPAPEAQRRRSRINPRTKTSVDVYFARTASRRPAPLHLTTLLLPHQGQPALDTIVFSVR